MCGAKGTSPAEAVAFGDAARRLLGCHPAPYLVTRADPVRLLDVDYQHAALITQRTVSIAGTSLETNVVSRFDREADSWLALAGAIAEREAQTRLRVTMLATELGLADQLYLNEQLEAARAISSNATDPELEYRGLRAQATILDLLESYRSPLWIGEIALVSEAPLPDLFVRLVASTITNELDVIHVGEHAATASPVVAGRRRLVGGYAIERDPEGLREALRSGFPRAGMIVPRRLHDLFSATEAACAFRWPVPAGGAIPFVAPRASRPLPASAALPAEGCLVGHDPNGVEIRLGEVERMGHIHVLGATGTGKTTLIEALVRDDLANGRPFVLIDPHGDLAARAKREAEAQGRPLALLDPRESGSAGLALVEGVDSNGDVDDALVERSVARVIDAVTSHLPSDWHGPQFRSLARAALTLLAHSGTGHELGDISRVLGDVLFRNSLLRSYRGPSWVGERLEGLTTYRDRETPDWVASRFEDLTRQEAMRQLLAPIGSGVRVGQLVTQGVPLVCNPSKGDLSALSAGILGHLVLAATVDAALERPPGVRGLFNVYVDEAHSFPVVNLRRGLAEARKFGVGFVLAHQHLSQLPADARDAFLGNCAIRFAFRLTREDSFALTVDLGVPPRDLRAQPDLHAYTSYAVNGRALPTFSTIVPRPSAEPVAPQGRSGGQR
jgi:DNA helicase HerA-like ATPase